MTISNITVGTATTGLAGSVQPGAPGGLAVGDLVLVFAAARNDGVGVPICPTGYTTVASAGSVAIFGRFWTASDTFMPLVDFTSATDDTYARAMKARGVALDMLSNAATGTASNGSAQNISYSGLTVPGNDHLLVMMNWKQDDATSVATPAGWTAQGLTNAIAGNDMMVSIFTQLQTTDTDITFGSVVVTGGVAAIGRSITLALAPAPAISALVVNLYPPRVLISVTGLTPADSVQLYRVVGSTRTAVRSGYSASVTDPSFLRADAELPFDVPVTYLAVVNSLAEYSTAAVTYALPGGKGVLSDAITGAAAEAVVVSWPTKKYERQASLFKVGGRNVVVSGDIGMFESTIEVFFEAYSSTENFFDMLGTATEGILQLRAPLSTYEGVDCYVAVLAATEQRFSQDGSDGRRTWQLEVAEVEPWSLLLEARAFTLQDVGDYYTGLQMLNYGNDYATMLLAAQGDYS